MKYNGNTFVSHQTISESGVRSFDFTNDYKYLVGGARDSTYNTPAGSISPDINLFIHEFNGTHFDTPQIIN